MNKFKFELDSRVLHRNSVCVVVGRAQYIVRTNNMYMLQPVIENIEFEVDMGKTFWEEETKLEISK